MTITGATVSIWEQHILEEREANTIQKAADALANAKANYDRLVAHRTDRLNRARASGARNLREMG